MKRHFLSNILFPSASLQIEYSVRANKGWAPPETHDPASCLFLNTGRQVKFVHNHKKKRQRYLVR